MSEKTRDFDAIKTKIEKLNNLAESMSAQDALQAYEAALEALELSETIKYKPGITNALFYLGESLYRQGKIFDAIDNLRKSLNLSEEIKDDLVKSRVLTILGNVHLYLKLFDLAFYYFKMALATCELIERYESQAMILNNVGEIYRELGDYERALESYGKCLDISEKNSFERVGMYATANIGVTDYETKNYQAAIYFLEKSLTSAKKLKNQIVEGYSTRYLGLLHMDMGNYNEAKKYFKEAMKVYIDSNETSSQARLLKDLAQLEYNNKDFDKTLDYLNEAKKLLDTIQDNRLMILIYDLFSRVYEDLGDCNKACEFSRKSIDLRYEKENQEKEHRLKSIDFQVKTWDALKESENYQRINKKLQEKTETLEKVTKELQKINKEVKALSDMDGLTRIANRIKLDDYAQEICAKAFKSKNEITMMIIDIDNFKEYNDFYGHLIGDEALKKLARILEKSIEGKEGLVARFGGDEFVVIIYDCSVSEAKEIAKYITKTLKTRKIRHEKSDVAPYLTVSVGIISKVPQRKTTYALLMDFADQALYQAKEKGKNQTEVYES